MSLNLNSLYHRGQGKQMTMTTVFSSATALLSSDFISNYSGSDLDALLTKLRRHIGIQINTDTETISIAGTWTSVLEAHVILRDSVCKAQSTFDGSRSTTWLEDEVSTILELDRNENEQTLEDEFDSQVRTCHTVEDVRNGNEESFSNNTRTEENDDFILKDVDSALKSIESETILEKQKKDIILDHTYFKYSDECGNNSAVIGDDIAIHDYISAGLVLENLAKQYTELAFVGDENDQVLLQQTQIERTAAVMEPIGSVVKVPVPSQFNTKTSLLSNGSDTQDTVGIDMIDKDQKKSSTRSKTFERHSETSLKEIQTINNTGTFPSGEREYVCKSKSQKELQRVKKHFDGRKCDQCDKNFACKSDLNEHRKKEHNLVRVHKNSRWKKIPNTVGPFPCYECDYIGKSRDRIKEHWVRAHSRRFKCNDCGKFFGQNTELKRHRNTVHAPARVCEYCDKSYKTKRSYDYHLASHHGDGISHLYTCDTCNKRFASMKNISSHIEKEHLGIPARKILCHICGKKFGRKQSYNQHRDSHSGIKLYQCDSCKKRFLTKQGYQEHILIHTDRVKHECEICGKSYLEKRYLRLHKNAYHSDEQRHSFQCEICGRKCISNYRLQSHMKIHAKSRDHVCNICGKDFTQLTSLIRHQRIHSDDKPYSCLFCSKKSTDVSVIRRHVMLVHKKDPKNWQEAVVRSIKLKSDT